MNLVGLVNDELIGVENALVAFRFCVDVAAVHINQLSELVCVLFGVVLICKFKIVKIGNF